MENRKLKKVILYGVSSCLKDVYYGMRPCCHILGLADQNAQEGKEMAQELNIPYIEPEQIKRTGFQYICVTAAYGSIYRDLVYKFGVKRSQIFPYQDFYREIELSLGDLNPDKTIYVIRFSSDRAGFFAVLMCIINNLLDLPDDYEVYFDFMNYKNIYMKSNEIGEVNSFEKWFVQPCGLSAEEVYHSKNIILAASVGWSSWIAFEELKDLSLAKKYVQAMRKYLRPNQKFHMLLEEERKRVFCDGKKICAVIFRGTDYLLAKTYGHPIHPDINQMISQVKKLKEQWKFQKIYLSTEDAEGQKKFIEEFGDDVLFSERELISNYPILPGCADLSSAIVDICFERENDEYLKGMEYLRQIFIAAECSYMISGINSAYRGALLLSGGFEKCYEFHLGHYGTDDDSYATPWGHYVLLEEEKKVEKRRIEEYEARCRGLG